MKTRPCRRCQLRPTGSRLGGHCDECAPLVEWEHRIRNSAAQRRRYDAKRGDNRLPLMLEIRRYRECAVIYADLCGPNANLQSCLGTTTIPRSMMVQR